MKERKSAILLALLGIMLVFVMMPELCAPVYAAADPVMIWDFESDESRLNANVAEGTTSETSIGYKLKDISERSHSWSVDDESICQIAEGANNRLSLTGVKEGVTRVRLSVKATDGNTYADYIIVSVYSRVTAAYGTTARATMAYRMAHSTTENKNERGTLPAGTRIKVTGKCGNYYRVYVSPDDYVFTDELDSGYAYIKAGDSIIPVTEITLDKDELSMKEGEISSLKATVLPEIATDKAFQWRSSDVEVVTVDEQGDVAAIGCGDAEVEVSIGDITARCQVNVSEEAGNSTLELNTPRETLGIGETYKLYEVKGMVQSYSSTDPDVVSVRADGIIEGITPGKAKVIAVNENGEKATCKVTVVGPEVPDLTFNIAKGKKYNLSWSKVRNVTGYQVLKKKSSKAAYKVIKTVSASGTRSIVTAKGQYQVRSYKVNRKGKKIYSGVASIYLGKWMKGKNEIVFAGNGAAGRPYGQSLDFKKKTRIVKNKFKRKGYTFVGWATSKKGPVVLKNGARMRCIASKKRIMLYAIWRNDKTQKGKVQRRAFLYADTRTSEFRRDVEQMKRVYSRADFDGKKIEVTTCARKEKTKIEKQIMKIGQNTTKNDVTYLHFSCHGLAWRYGKKVVGGGELCVTKDSYITPSELRTWLDDYVDGKVVITIASCYSGKFMKKMIGTETVSTKGNQFVNEFKKAGTGKKALKKNGKYKILTSSGNGYSWRTEGGMSDAVLFWSRGLGVTESGKNNTLFADTNTCDSWGYQGYGNLDGKVTLKELFKYSESGIYEGIVACRKKDPVPVKENKPQLYPANDELVIYQR